MAILPGRKKVALVNNEMTVVTKQISYYKVSTITNCNVIPINSLASLNVNYLPPL